jgi:DNA-binding NarL/FixJ family response regulator
MSAIVELPSPVDVPDDSVTAIVCDTHAVSRIGLGVLLHRQRWMSRCLLASDRDEAAGLIGHHKPNIAIVDVSDAGPFIASYLAPLHSAHPAMPILLSSHYRLPPRPLPSAGGVVGMLSPAVSPADLLEAVRAALVQNDVPAFAPDGHLDVLSAREREVLALLSTGATNREIAAALQVGTETVKKHAGALYRKLGVRNRTQAAQRAFELLAA